MKMDKFIECLEVSHTPQAKDIAKLEKKFGINFPADYRAFLEQSYGGYGRGMVIDGAWEFVPFAVGGITDDENLSLEKRNQDFAPEGLFWIMEDEGGNPLKMSFAKRNFGKIYIIDHETAMLEETPLLFAKSFESLVKKAKVKKIIVLTEEQKKQLLDPAVQHMLSGISKDDPEYNELAITAIGAVADMREVLGERGIQQIMNTDYSKPLR